LATLDRASGPVDQADADGEQRATGNELTRLALLRTGRHADRPALGDGSGFVLPDRQPGLHSACEHGTREADQSQHTTVHTALTGRSGPVRITGPS
jgi:hypothetical protein